MAENDSGAPLAPLSDSLVEATASTSIDDTDPTSQHQDPQSRTSQDESEWVCLQHEPLDVAAIMARVKDPAAGAVVLFVGTTRDNFGGAQVERLSYSAYTSLALKTLAAIAANTRQQHALQAIAIAHRLGDVPVGVESIVVAVSAAHRGAAWQAGQDCLEAVKSRAEIWKKEMFAGGRVTAGGRDGEPGTEVEVEADGGVWRANAQTDSHGNRVTAPQATETVSGQHEHEQDQAHDDWSQYNNPSSTEVAATSSSPSQNHAQHRQHNTDNDQHAEQETQEHDDERRRIADESRRQWDLELERGWGGA